MDQCNTSEGLKEKLADPRRFQVSKAIEQYLTTNLLYQQTSMLVEWFSVERPNGVPLA